MDKDTVVTLLKYKRWIDLATLQAIRTIDGTVHGEKRHLTLRLMIHYPSYYLMGTHEEPDSFINSLLIMKKKEMFFALLFYCFSALQLSVYCNVYCRMRFYGWREQVKRQGAKSLTW